VTEQPVERWSERRWKQLESLTRILNECQSLNRVSSVIERMQFLINESKLLTDDDYKKPEGSFVRFLQEQARHDYAQSQEDISNG